MTGIVDTLQQLVLKARQEVEGPVCLIIDGLSLLLNVGVALGDVVVLVQMCMQMLTLSKGPCQVSYGGITSNSHQQLDHVSHVRVKGIWW